jgi:triacylglycerol esterase/lipase EstA (alpha/beta hydrolase family)
MIAGLMRLLWVLIVCASAAAAWLSIRLLGPAIGSWSAGLLGIMIVAASHPLLIATNFALSRRHGDAVPDEFRLSAWQALLTYDAEIDASMRGVWFATPFLAHRPAARPPAGTVLQPLPILFIHGYLCNRAVWLSFMRDAAARGYLCEAVTLPDPLAAIDAQLRVVDHAIDALLAAAREAGIATTRVALVGHSMGGLVARAARVRLPGERIGPVITLGTPHHGTHAARFGRAPSVVQMRRDSQWLAALAEEETSRDEVPPMTTLFSYHDDIVYPQTTGALAGATQRAISGVGHVALLYDKRVRALVFEALGR